ncbi:hypothetical protein M409DRAFT_17970 [Zasmidium cellare ATCC 36951]|uniref:Uncharacterized protein n=1 Tax=Zasmidium cellare ATCC 36951 TaxID=1080233 RepID=A0A6A6CXH2_ZASCE|nr:uncharacterized protein M409DRAFT_17970 [Zasmidium cellare ATCC 36951]KAF2171735.1 hypothetical protein M409DRAFT_17970 [Zasmidium cellare ATCC 36951]
MATNTKRTARAFASSYLRPASTRTFLNIHTQQQQRPSSAATIALKASTKYPAHKLLKKPRTSVGTFLTGQETAQVSRILHAIDQRKQLRALRRERVWTGAKYVWKFVEATYLSFTLFVMYMATLDYVTGGEVSKGGGDEGK